MRSARWAHVGAVAVMAGATAIAAPLGTTRAGSGSAGSGSPVAATAAAAPIANAEPVAVPPVPASAPLKFAVAPFENHSNVKSLDWVIAGAPFEIAEKSQQVLGLDATGGALVVGAPIDPTAAATAALATSAGARWVITGYFERPNWQLSLHVRLWRVDGGVATIVGNAARTDEPATYHQMIGALTAELWAQAGIVATAEQATALARPLAPDLYAVTLMGRGLGHLSGALGAVDLKAAEHDLERATFIAPKLYEAQRLLGELDLAEAPGDAKAAAKATGKFNYAHDLAPEDIASLRAAAFAAANAGKHDVALELFHALVVARPWDLEARYQLGAALWATGDATGAQHQLEQVTARAPDDLPARRVLALIHAARGDTAKLVAELEAIALRAPADLDVKADLATAYGALGQWPEAVAQLEMIAAVRPGDVALVMRIGDGQRRAGQLDDALQWYARAAKLAPDSSWPGFIAAQALYDAGRVDEAIRAYTQLQRFKDDLPATEHALGVLALAHDHPDDAIALLRRAVHDAPRAIASRRMLIAAELEHKDAEAALAELAPALAAWPDDAELVYFAGIAHALAGDRATASTELTRALALEPGGVAAREALGALQAGGSPTLHVTPMLVRPWGDAEALAVALDRYATTTAAMAAVRIAYQDDVLGLLGTLGKGPLARAKVAGGCPLGELAPSWSHGQDELARYARLGVELEATWKYIARHDEAGATAALLPAARTAVAADRKAFRVALADVGELRAEWSRGIAPELRAVGCTDKLLAAAIADPARYQRIVDDAPDRIPPHAAPRPRPRATFFVDNTGCSDPVDVWVDGAQLGQVAPGRRSALVGDAGERTLCLELPGAAACGDRGTVRSVYLHDGWAVTMHCPK